MAPFVCRHNMVPLLSIAPMIDWTNTYFRIFMRLLAPEALLYTEMQTCGAVLNNPKRALMFHAMEKPLALQLGGADVPSLVQCAVIAEKAGFTEVNLNIGCPSDKVQAGSFGACLMLKPDLVAEAITAMKAAVSIPVTAKIRIGIDTEDSFAFFLAFVTRLVNAGCDTLIVHARKAWLKGLSPKQNRTIPPLQYDYVYQLRDYFPEVPIVINGNIQTLEAIQGHLQYTDGVMLGRLAIDNPYAIHLIHQALYPQSVLSTRQDLAREYLRYANHPEHASIPHTIRFKPLLSLAHGIPHAKQWRMTCAAGNIDLDLMNA